MKKTFSLEDGNGKLDIERDTERRVVTLTIRRSGENPAHIDIDRVEMSKVRMVLENAFKPFEGS